MNEDINKTFASLVPVLQMNGEKVESIEAVRSWYKAVDKYGNGKEREFCKEVAEITYKGGYRIYADIGGDSNLTACYDVLAVIQQIKHQSSAIDRIERGVYDPA